MKKRNNILLGSIIAYFGFAVSIASGLFFTPWVTKTIGQGMYGVFTLLNSLIALTSVDFGISTATAKFLCDTDKNDLESRKKIINSTQLIYLIVDLVIAIIYVFVYIFLERIFVKLEPNEFEALKFSFLFVSIYSIISFPLTYLNSVFLAYEDYLALKGIDLLYKTTNVLLSSFFLLLGLNLFGLIIGNIIAGSVCLIIKVIRCKKDASFLPNPFKIDKVTNKTIIGFSVWIAISAFGQRLIFSITPSILGIVSNSIEISIFGIVNILEGYVYSITSVISSMLLPKINNVKGDKSIVEKYMIRIGRIQFSIISIITIGFLCIGRQFISRWVGNEYAPVFFCLILILIPSLIHDSQGVLNNLLINEGKAKEQGIIYLIMGIINVALTFVFGSIWGSVGACISICVAYLFRTISLNVFFKHNLKVHIGKYYAQVVLAGLIPFLISMCLSFSLSNLFVAFASWMVVITNGLIVLVVCAISFWFFYLRKHEASFVKDLIKRKHG